jgi:UDP-hydrolysing UDP-N-acetyl-D-glucosamine 2-epimerase
MKKKICFVISSRANYGRLKQVLLAIKKDKRAELQIILSASSILARFGDIRKNLKEDGLNFNYHAFVIVEGDEPINMAKSTGLSIIELSTALNNLKPDVVVTTGDRYETLATAISASYMNIVLAHIQGGEITGSIDESVRHAITKLSHIHFAATKKAKNNILRLGENKKYVFNTGCPSIDLLKINKKSINNVKDLTLGVGNKFNFNKPFILVVFHPVTTDYKNSFKQAKALAEAINGIKFQVIWLWPNIDSGSDQISKCIRQFREQKKLSNVSFYKNFSVEDYNSILREAKCLVGNSSSFIREGSYLGVPCVLLGNRQTGRETARNVLYSNFHKAEILSKIKKQTLKRRYKKSYLYGDGNSSKIIKNYLIKLKPNIQKKLFF